MQAAETLEFQAHYPHLFGIAYRMLGSASDAEDMVQEAYLRYTPVAGGVQAPRAYLTRIVTNLCLDELKSARARREQYVGPWLPEPILTADAVPGPLGALEQRETISLAFVTLLECLTPHERAVFLLHDVFDYTYAEIGEITGKSAAACRQIGHRARTRLDERRPRFAPAPDAQQRLTERFLAACGAGDMHALTELLVQDVVWYSDGGGKVLAARRPVLGRENVARLVFGLLSKAPPDARFTLETINGGPAILIWIGTALNSVIVLDVAGAQIGTAYVVLNPDKLAYLLRQLAAR